MLSDRVAIVPPLAPDLAHIGGKANQVPPINFGEIFDMPRLRKELNWPVLEWADIKIAAYDLPLSRETTPVPGAVMEELGCWGISSASKKENKNVGHSVLEMLLQLGEFLRFWWFGALARDSLTYISSSSCAPSLLSRLFVHRPPSRRCRRSGQLPR